MALTEKQKQAWVLTTIPQVADLFGVSHQTVDAWIRAGMPREDATTRTSPQPKFVYRVWEIIPWWRDKYQRRGTEESPIVEQTRRVKLVHAQLDLAERRGQLVDLEQMRAVCQVLSSVYRDLGERLVARFGRDAGQMVNDAREEYQRRMDNDFPRPTAGTGVSLLDGATGNGAARALDKPVGGGTDRRSPRRSAGAVSSQKPSG